MHKPTKLLLLLIITLSLFGVAYADEAGSGGTVTVVDISQLLAAVDEAWIVGIAAGMIIGMVSFLGLIRIRRKHESEEET